MKAKGNVHESLEKLRHKLRLDKLAPSVRKVVVGVVGCVVIVAGIAMIVFPGPAFIVIPLGLFILAIEFRWAERWAQKAQDGIRKGRTKWRQYKRRRANSRA